MKMAKASTADIDAAIEISEALASLNNGWLPVPLRAPDDDFTGDKFDAADGAACRLVLECLLNTYRKARIDRVVYGMAILLDPANKAVDPNATTLEHHPDIQTLEKVREEITRHYEHLDQWRNVEIPTGFAFQNIQNALGMRWVPDTPFKTENVA